MEVVDFLDFFLHVSSALTLTAAMLSSPTTLLLFFNFSSPTLQVSSLHHFYISFCLGYKSSTLALMSLAQSTALSLDPFVHFEIWKFISVEFIFTSYSVIELD